MTDQHPPTDGPFTERRKTSDHDAYFNAQFDAEPVYVEPGTVSCAESDGEMLVSTVGSGVLLTIHDEELKVATMAYIILPNAVLEAFPFLDQADQSLVAKAFEPIDDCIGEMKRRGAGKNRIRIRMFGGVIRESSSDDQGLKNTVFVQEYLFRKGLRVYNADIGGPFIRRVHFFPGSGRVVRRLLKRESDLADIQALESQYNKNITSGA